MGGHPVGYDRFVMGCRIEELMVAWDEKTHRLVMVGNDTLGFREFAARTDHWLPAAGDATTGTPTVLRRGIEGDSDLWKVVESFCDERALVFPWRFLEIIPDEDVLARAASEKPHPPTAAN